MPSSLVPTSLLHPGFYREETGHWLGWVPGLASRQAHIGLPSAFSSVDLLCLPGDRCWALPTRGMTVQLHHEGGYPAFFLWITQHCLWLFYFRVMVSLICIPSMSIAQVFHIYTHCSVWIIVLFMWMVTSEMYSEMSAVWRRLLPYLWDLPKSDLLFFPTGWILL